MKNFTISIRCYDEKGRYSLDWCDVDTNNPKKVLDYLSTVEDINFKNVVSDFISALKDNVSCTVRFHEGFIKINKPACPTEAHKIVADVLRDRYLRKN